MADSSYEGFDSCDVFADSISDGFTNQINDRLPPEAELWPNMDGYSLLCDVFGHPLTRRRIEELTADDVAAFLAALNEDGELEFSQQDVIDCIRGALWQSFGEAKLKNF